MIRNFAILALSSLLFVGCLKTRADLNEKEEQKAIQSQISEIRQSKADQELKTQTYENELRNMLGRIELLERQIAQMQQNQSLGQGEVAKQNKDLLDQMKIFEDQLNQVSMRLEKMERPPRAEIEDAKPQAGSTTTKTKSYWDKAEELFVKKDWKNAALAYDEYTKQYPKGTNVSMAFYKMGVCFQELKMNDQAKSFFEEVLTKFPNSGAARKAKYRLNQIK